MSVRNGRVLLVGGAWQSWSGSSSMVAHYVHGADEETYCGLLSAHRLDADAPVSRPCLICMVCLIRDGVANVRLPGWDQRIRWFETPTPVQEFALAGQARSGQRN